MPSARSKRFVAVVAALGALAIGSIPAAAAPGRPRLGPFIEEGSYYQGQTKCSPWAKPGVVAFQRKVLAAYPGTGAGSIGRACTVGGTSEHKEGRAWDWGVNVANPSQKAAADNLLAWLAAEDRHGNKAAMGRRLGVMYAIWNKRIWFPGSGWRTYCVVKRGACRDPEDGDVRHPHTDHVHFSFTWDGAKKKTTYWNPKRTFATGVASNPFGGLWVAGGNGGVRAYGNAWSYGSKSGSALKRPIVDIEATPSGDGYWMLASNGRAFRFGQARRLRSRNDIRAADLAVTPTGDGYWILARGGRVFAFGDAQAYGTKRSDGSAVALEPTPSGAGYWVVWSSGQVRAFGDAQPLGDASGEVVDLDATPTGLGYWVATANGKVQAFGDAQPLGTSARSPAGGLTGLVPTPTGAGYWLVDGKANVRPVGDATSVSGSSSGSISTFSLDRALDLISE